MCVCCPASFHLLEIPIVDTKLVIALNEFFYVAKGLVVIIAIVSVLTGIMREYIPQDKLQATLTKHDKWGTLLGALFGMLTPFCSAAVVPVTMAMASMGASLGTVMSFIISAPLCNFIVLAMVYAAFGLKITVVYFLVTFIAAVVGGYLISKSPWRNEVMNLKTPKTKAVQVRAIPKTQIILVARLFLQHQECVMQWAELGLCLNELSRMYYWVRRSVGSRQLTCQQT